MANYEDRPLIGYIPTVLRKVREYQALTHGEQTEVFDLFKNIQNVLDNQFVETSTEYGVKRWEALLKIAPIAMQTLDERKFVILMRLAERLPFSYRALERFLADLCGEGNYTIVLNANEYLVRVQLEPFSNGTAELAANLLRRVVPANMLYGLISETIQVRGLYYLGASLQSNVYKRTCRVEL